MIRENQLRDAPQLYRRRGVLRASKETLPSVIGQVTGFLNANTETGSSGRIACTVVS
jgi:hypothetical protein